MRILDNRDFTLKKYEKLCEAVIASRYNNVTFKEYFEQENTDGGFILIRHDIDANAKFALDMAKVEYDYGIRGTYYFRTIKKVYVPDIIARIASYNHEIGYHYETVDKAKGNVELAIELFSEELAMFRKEYDVKTVCMHGNPLSKYDNKEIWVTCKLSDFDLVCEPYLSLDYNRFAYFSDSGRTWEDKNKIKDKIDAPKSDVIQVKNTDELIAIIAKGEPENVCILTHPVRWPKNPKDYLIRYVIDLSYIIGKKVIKSLRGGRMNEKSTDYGR